MFRDEHVSDVRSTGGIEDELIINYRAQVVLLIRPRAKLRRALRATSTFIFNILRGLALAAFRFFGMVQALC